MAGIDSRFSVTVHLSEKEMKTYNPVLKELNLSVKQLIKLGIRIVLKIARLIKNGGGVILFDAHGNLERLSILELEGLLVENKDEEV